MKLIRIPGRKTRKALVSKLDREDITAALAAAIILSPRPKNRTEWVEAADWEYAARHRAWRRLHRKFSAR